MCERLKRAALTANNQIFNTQQIEALEVEQVERRIGNETHDHAIHIAKELTQESTSVERDYVIRSFHNKPFSSNL